MGEACLRPNANTGLMGLGDGRNLSQNLLRSIICAPPVLGILMYTAVHSGSCARSSRKFSSLATILREVPIVTAREGSPKGLDASEPIHVDLAHSALSNARPFG
jgi:hypothetical protein